MPTLHDARFSAFIAPDAPDVFRSVLSTSDVWRPDPLDVASIHASARAEFESVISATQSRTADAYRRLVLLQGVSGSGKTHLVASMRNNLHESRRGFFTYMQMQTAIADYGRYVLWNVIASLEKPMQIDFSPESAFETISRAIYGKAVRAHFIDESRDEGSFDAYDVAEKLRQAGLYHVDTRMLAAFLVLARHDVMEAEVVSRYLRCEPLTPRDTKRIDFLTTRSNPIDTLQSIARVIDETFAVPLVICLDQLDNFYTSEAEGGKRFQEATAALDAIVNGDDGATIVVVVAILDDQYAILRAGLLQPQIDRYELGTRPIRLDGNASGDQIRAVLERRLSYLYEKAGVRVNASDALFPYSADAPERLGGSRLRTALRALGEARMRSIASGSPPTILGGTHTAEDVPTGELVLSERWNDASLSPNHAIPTDREELIDLLRFGVEAIAPELPAGLTAQLTIETDAMILERVLSGAREREMLSIANEAAQFGHLGKAVARIEERAKTSGTTAVLVRSADYPSSPKSKITEQLGLFMKAGNRRLTFPPGDWRTLAAYRTFAAEHRSRPDFAAWVLEAKPLTALPGMQALLQLDEAVPAAPSAVVEAADAFATEPAVQPIATEAPAAKPVTPAPRATTSRPTEGGIRIGSDENGRSTEIDPLTLTRHTAILGGAGSGKTTLAFSIIEGLLARGIPAILVDRKGDLACLGDPMAWQKEVDPERAARRAALLSKLIIDIYTPGSNAGRNLGISALPSGLVHASVDDRDEAARSAALSLATMLEYGAAKKERLAVLDRAIATLAAVEEILTLDKLIEFIDSADPALVAAIGRLKPKTLDAVAADLSVLKINAKRLLAAEAEPLDVERLLGLGVHARAGKTRLSIISTKALGDGIDSLFWISRLLADFARFTSRNPKAQLQAVAFFDEADRYLPATSKPITKEPMENLLKRARSGGLGIMLATQSPGDLDYKSKENITTWLVGRVNQDQAREKLEGVLGNPKTVERLPQLKTGDFYLKNEAGLAFFHGSLPGVMPEQLEEARILDLAGKRNLRPSNKAGS